MRSDTVVQAEVVSTAHGLSSAHKGRTESWRTGSTMPPLSLHHSSSHHPHPVTQVTRILQAALPVDPGRSLARLAAREGVIFYGRDSPRAEVSSACG